MSLKWNISIKYEMIFSQTNKKCLLLTKSYYYYLEKFDYHQVTMVLSKLNRHITMQLKIDTVVFGSLKYHIWIAVNLVVRIFIAVISIVEWSFV